VVGSDFLHSLPHPPISFDLFGRGLRTHQPGVNGEAGLGGAGRRRGWRLAAGSLSEREGPPGLEGWAGARGVDVGRDGGGGCVGVGVGGGGE
jgi:hypothetical protein